jgi:hypothetical protein
MEIRSVPIFKTNLPKFRFLEKIIPTVLFGDNKNPHVEHHLLILSRSCCILFCRCLKLGPDFHHQQIETYRTLQVRINNTCSDIYIVQNGTPQGSCISPTHFNIMVNDLSQVLLILTCNVLLLKKPFTYDSILPYIFRDTIFCSRSCFHNISNA